MCLESFQTLLKGVELALTLFSIPKPFEGHLAVIQKNAIESWRLLHPDCQILLFGDEPGVKKAAREVHAVHIPDATRNEFGTPLLHTVFSDARRAAAHSLLCYVNADIILMKDFLRAARRIDFGDFMMVGRRWNIDIEDRLDFMPEEWEAKLIQRVQREGELGAADAIDYFLFPKDWGINDMPAFAVGRPGWDNWLIFRARQLRIPVIDVTQATMVIHQNHGYGHVPRQKGDQWEGPEADRNRQLVGDLNRIFTLLDVSHVMTKRGIRHPLSYAHIRRRWQTLGVLYPRLYPYARVLSKILNLGRKSVGTGP